MDKLNKPISQIWNDDYVVPIYQRNYAWGEEQIGQLLQDIYDASQNEDSNYFIGSLVVLLRTDGVYEVIDGQQRLTTFHLICKELDILNQSHLTYDSRPEVEEFFNELFASKSCSEFLEDCSKRDTRKIYHLIAALEILESTGIHTHAGYEDDTVVSLNKMPDEVKNKMAEYLNNNVILVRTILPDDTDVAAYFEIMNNRGEQLQEHEIVKALMMKSLNEEQRQVFASIWDACSQMSVPIQHSLSSFRKNMEHPLFGIEYDSLQLDYVQYYSQEDSTEDYKTLDDIIVSPTVSFETNKEHPEKQNYDSIIDFPNFLMLVFKTYNAEIQLNADHLQKAFEKLKSSLDLMEFIKRLLKYRILFDRYVVKTTSSDENEESIRWVLKKPYRSRENELRFRNTFSVNRDEPDENEIENNVQKRIVKQLSMLQVSFRDRKYKNWLFEYLKHLYQFEPNTIRAESIIQFLDNWMLSFYNHLLSKYCNDSLNWPFESLGVYTPRFLFNFIDYLYWVESCNPKPENHIPYIEEVKDFDFKYYNSVEHHLPQSYVNIDDVNIDNIGNLCLISRSGNSSLNDKAPKEKARITEGLLPKRRIMYSITQYHDGWNRKQIEEHCKDIEDLLNKRQSILNIK